MDMAPKISLAQYQISVEQRRDTVHSQLFAHRQTSLCNIHAFVLIWSHAHSQLQICVN